MLDTATSVCRKAAATLFGCVGRATVLRLLSAASYLPDQAASAAVYNLNEPTALYSTLAPRALVCDCVAGGAVRHRSNATVQHAHVLTSNAAFTGRVGGSVTVARWCKWGGDPSPRP